MAALALQWPVEPVLSPPGIMTQLGDWDASGLHRAIDIPRLAGTTVRSVEDGCVIGLDPAQQAIIIAQACGTASVESWAYVHVLNTTGLTSGSLVIAGQAIGEVSNFYAGTQIPNHLHFGRQNNPLLQPNLFAGQIPRNPLLFYQDNLPAAVAVLDEAKILFVPDQTTNQSAFINIGARTAIFENVDILAEAHNTIANEMRPGVFSISFEASGGPPTSSGITERTLVAFRQMPFSETSTIPGGKFSLIYAPGLSTDFQGTYVVTNAGTAAPMLSNGVSNVIENAWFTRARAGVNDSAGGLTATQLARANIEAKYPDGRYQVTIKAGTFLDDHTGSRSKEVLVDNFRPFFVSAGIGTPVKFAKQWNWNGVLFTSAGPSPNGALAPGSHALTLVFSEPVATPSVSFNDSGIRIENLASNDPIDTQRMFTATLVIDSTVADGNKTMSVAAKDLGGNDLLAVGSSDTTIDPATQLTRNVSGMQGVGGPARVNFSVKRPPPPRLTLADDARQLFTQLFGLAVAKPTSSTNTATFEFFDPTGIVSITLPGTFHISDPPGGFTPGVTRVAGTLTNLALGANTISARNTSDGETKGTWLFQELSMSAAGAVGTASFNTEPDGSYHFDFSLPVAITASAGISAIDRFNPTALTSLEQLTGTSLIYSSNTKGGIVADYQLRDSEGKTVIQQLSIGNGELFLELNAPGATTFLVSDFRLMTSAYEHAFLRPAVFLASAAVDGSGVSIREIEPLDVNIPIVAGEVTLANYDVRYDGNILSSGVFQAGGTGPSNTGGAPKVEYPFTSDIDFSVFVETAAPTTANSATCLLLSPAQDRCLRVKQYAVDVNFRARVAGAAYTLTAPSAHPATRIFPGGNQTVPLGLGVTLSALTATSAVDLSVDITPGTIEPGYANALSSSVYSLNTSNAGALNSNFRATLPFLTGLTAAERARLRVGKMGSCGLTPISPTVTESAAEAQLSGFGKYSVIVSTFAAPVTVEEGRCRFTSDLSVVTAAEGVDTPGAAQAINVLGSLGLQNLGSTCDLGPTGTTFTPSFGVMKVCVDTATLAGLPEGQVELYQFNELGLREPLLGLTVDREFGYVAGKVGQFSSLFNIFAQTTTITPAVDLLPPITTLLLDGTTFLLDAPLSVRSTTTIALSARDPPFPGAPNSGVSQIYYLLDLPFISTAATPGSPYLASFQLPPGSHSLVFYAVDNAGNHEAVHSSSITSTVPPQRGSGGLGIGRDGFGQLWTIVNGDESVALARVDSAGALLSSTTLPDASPSFHWSVFFDDAGHTYAIGTAQGSGTAGADLAVYRVSAVGDAVVSSRTFDSGSSNNDFAFDSAFPGWISGAAQTSGPISSEEPGERVFSLALWRFDAGQEALSLAAIYARGAGFDVGTSVAVDDSGNAWVAGFSQGPSADPERPFDLALWKFNASGALVAGPFLRPGYLAEYDGTLLARVFLSSGAVYVTAPRSRAAAPGTDLGLVKFDAGSGAVLLESFWSPDDGSAAYPAAILADGAQVLVAGSHDDGGTIAGLWRYGADAVLSAATLVEAGGAQGAVFQGGDLWLAVDGSTAPYRVTAEIPAAGNFLDTRPPRSSLSAGLPSFIDDKIYATNATTFTIATVDDRVSVGDGQGVGSTVTFVSADGPSFSPQSGPFGYAGEGLHPVFFYSVDLAGNAETVSSRTIAVDLTAPVVALVSTGSLFAVEAVDLSTQDAASGVAQVNYLVDADPESCGGVEPSTSAPPGTCANLSYAGPFALAPGTHTVLFQAIDRVGNGADVISSSAVVVASSSAYAVTPAVGPIGTPIVITGSGFGARDGSRTRVLFGGATASISSWVDTEIHARAPNLSTGAYALTVERRTSTGAVVSAVPLGSFEVVAPVLASMFPVSAPIGTTATLTGTGFGPRDGSRTRVLFGGATAQISSWDETTIKVTIPGVAAGTTTVVVERASPDGGLVRSGELVFGIESLGLSAITPASGPVGTVFRLDGADLGERSGVRTQVLFGGTTAQVISWTDTASTASVPNLPPGFYEVWVQRVSGSSVSVSNTLSFELVPLVLMAVSPTEGPIGTTFTVTGSGFGARDGSRTRVTVAGTAASIISWSDAEIKGRIPGVSSGPAVVLVERDARSGGTQISEAGSFAVTVPVLTAISPSSAPIGAPVILTGTSFGLRDGSRTRVLFGDTTAQITSWSDTSIAVRVPGVLEAGVYDLAVERESVDDVIVRTAAIPFEVLIPVVDAMDPTSGLPKALVNLTGHGFGPANGSNTRVLLGGTTVAVSVWSDTVIRWKVPTAAVPGDYPVVVRRTFGGRTVEVSAGTFTVTTAMSGFSALSAPHEPSVNTMAPMYLEGSMAIAAEEGGRVEAPAGAAVEVPPLALEEEKTISVGKAGNTGELFETAQQGKLKGAGPALEFGPHGAEFAVPVTIELPYDPAAIPPGQSESGLKVYYFHPGEKKWQALDSVVDLIKKVVKAQTSHFSIYQPMAIGVTTAAQDEFYLRDHFAYPNPARGGLVTFRVQPGLADTVEVRVYDIAGRKVYSSSDFAHTAPGGEHQYENVWNVSGVGSGVYTYAIRASRAGQRTISKTGKVGIVK